MFVNGRLHEWPKALWTARRHRERAGDASISWVDFGWTSETATECMARHVPRHQIFDYRALIWLA